jgi:hypothetical protein
MLILGSMWEAGMTHRSIGATVTALLVAAIVHVAAMGTSVAGEIDEARPMVNPHYVWPDWSWHLYPACQVQVKTPGPARYGVTSDDLLYCELPWNASRFPSDPCACTLTVGGVKVVRNGMVVRRPTSWGYTTRPWRPWFPFY